MDNTVGRVERFLRINEGGRQHLRLGQPLVLAHWDLPNGTGPHAVRAGAGSASAREWLQQFLLLPRDRDLPRYGDLDSVS